MDFKVTAGVSDIEIARGALDQGASVALAKGGALLASAEGHGVVPLLTVLRAIGDDARGASAADKVVGRSVAMVMYDAGIVRVHASVASRSAAEYLGDCKVPLTYDHLVEFITDRTGKGLCPVEQVSLGRDDAHAVRKDIEARFMNPPAKR